MTLTCRPEEATQADFLPRWTADHLSDVVLGRRHRQEYNGTSPRWIWFKELSVRTSFNPQRIDLWVMDTWGRMNAIAYEVKISRGDFRRELAKPDKREAAMAVSNQFYFATPSGLVVPSEVPEGCGLVEVHGGIVKVVVPAPRRAISPPGWEFFASVGRRGFRLIMEGRP